MGRLIHPLLAGGLLWALAGGCTTKDSLLDGPSGGSDNGGQGGSAAGTSGGKSGSAGSAGATAGASSGGIGTAGAGNAGNAGSDVGGSGAEGGDDDRGGSQGAGTSGGGSGGTAAGSAGTGSAGAAGSSSCPPDQIWCPGCTIGSGLCAAGGCPASACGPCNLVESLEECEARTDCHSVFEDPQTCGCDGLGCCAHFARCADNELADCSTGANIECDVMTPHCEAPHYVVSYTDWCYEGCVAPKDCAPAPPTACPPVVPENGSACVGDAECYYDACPEGLRAIARCSDGAWNVETGASCNVECAGVDQRCDPGEICHVQAGGALLADCVENGCGPRAILEECAGNCPIFFSLETGATVTCNTCPQGGCP
jgi:hypothetical protein